MACGGCNTSMGLTKDQIENLIQKLIDEGKLQAGLTDCEGVELGKGSKVLLCSVLAEKVNDLIKEGVIDVVTDVNVEDGKLVATDGTGKSKKLTTPFVRDLTFDATTNKLKWVEDGKDKEATLPYIKAAIGTNGVTLTLPDGSTVEVPKAGGTLSPDNLDHTIQKDANVPGKYGVKLDPKGGLTGDTVAGVGVKTGAGLTKDENGNLVLKLGDGLKTDGQGNLIIDPEKGAEQLVDALAGAGLIAENGQLKVATVQLVDASGTVKMGNLVDTTK